MHRLLSYSWIIAALAIVSCCSRVSPSEALVYENSEDYAMAHYLTEPQRSLEIIDSAVLAHALPPERADYLRAIIYYSSTNGIEKGASLCQKLIEDKAWESISDDDDARSFQVDIYRLMATIATTAGNNLSVLRYAREGAAIAHGDERLKGDEADFMSRMGYVMCKSGQVSEGLEIMQRAENLALSDNTWSSYVTYINNAKKQYHVYDDQNRYADAKDVIEKTLRSLDNLPDNIQNIKYAPQGMVTDPSALEEYIQYNQISFLSFLSCVYADENQLDSTRSCIQRIKGIPQSDNPAITKSLIYPLIVLGRYDEAEALIKATKEEIVGEEVNEDYLVLLKEEMRIAQLRGNDHEAAIIGEEIISVGDSLKASQFQIMLADEATQYQLQDEHQRRVDAENKLLIAIICIVLLAILIAGSFIYFYIRRILARHKELKSKYAKARKELEAITGEVLEEEEDPKTQEEIYNRAVSLVRDHKLFKDPTFDIIALAQKVPTNRSYLSSAINTMAQMNFRSWLANFRIDYAKEVLLKNPEITNDALAEECGFDNRVSLYRQFKSIVGVTPNEWIKSQTGTK